MQAGVHLTRPRHLRPVISVAPMIDILMILLVFFMVTSTYLDLDMIPAVTPEPETPAAAATSETPPTTLLIRVGADGQPAVAGRALDPAALQALVRDRLRAAPALQVVILPSGAADMQALVTVMDSATAAGATRLRVVRLEARP